MDICVQGMEAHSSRRHLYVLGPFILATTTIHPGGFFQQKQPGDDSSNDNELKRQEETAGLVPGLSSLLFGVHRMPPRQAKVSIDY